MIRYRTLHLLLGLITAAITFRSIHAQDTFILESPYLDKSVAGSQHFMLTGTLGGSGFFKPQPPCSGWTLFGDPTICLPIMLDPTPVEYVALKIADPQGKGRSVYQIVGDLGPPRYNYFLVAPKDPSTCSYDLTVRLPIGEFLPPVLLRPHPIPTLAADQDAGPELGVASYLAVQIGPRVSVYGYGVHPTTGYREFFQVGPEDVFPPILEFYVIPPDFGATIPTPFVATYSFHAGRRIERVQVRDKKGTHDVQVLQTSELPTAGLGNYRSLDLATVPRIVDVEYSIEKKNPPNLVVKATGQVPTLGWKKPRLLRRVYVTPPADGIWEYDLVATPPTGVTLPTISLLSATNRWKDYDQSIKGIRVFGIGNGVKEIRFPSPTK